METNKKQLIIIGDSSVYGWGDLDGGGWCERLKKHWMKESSAPIVYSLGIRGDGLEKVAKRWHQEWECRGELRRHVPEMLILNIGLNDTARIGRIDGRPQLSVDAFKFGLDRLLSEMKEKTNVMVMGLTPVIETLMPFAECLWYSNEASLAYERQIEEACIGLDIPFLATYKQMKMNPDWTNWIGPDGIHLNSKGHEWILNRVITWPSLLRWANSTG